MNRSAIHAKLTPAHCVMLTHTTAGVDLMYLVDRVDHTYLQ